jgi:hypothetical protein
MRQIIQNKLRRTKGFDMKYYLPELGPELTNLHMSFVKCYVFMYDLLSVVKKLPIKYLMH